MEKLALMDTDKKGAAAEPVVNINFLGPTVIGNSNTMTLQSTQDETLKLGVSDKIKYIPDDPDHFVGRTEVLDMLKTGFDGNKIIILHGMAGTGKSTIAKRFAHQQGMQYQNIIWVYMTEVSCHGKNAVNLIFRHILKGFRININDIKESDDICVHLNLTFGRFYSKQERTLIILDNLEEHLVIEEEKNVSSPIKVLFDEAVQTGKDLVHILGTSRCKADQQYFNGVKNIKLVPFTLEESKGFLINYPSNVFKCYEDLHKASCGFPLLLELFSSILNESGNEGEFHYHLEQITKQPVKTALVSSKYVKKCLNTSLELLNEDEMELAKTLCFFGEVISNDDAKDLCKEVNTKFFCVQQLKAKGIIKSTNKGFAMHPFLKEITNDRVSADQRPHYIVSLVIVYIRALLKLSKDSFEKDRQALMVEKFLDRMSSFNHLIGILDSLNFDDKDSFMEVIKTVTQKRLFAEHDPCLYFLLLRFLYHLVPRSNIRSIFQFLLDSSCKDSSKFTFQACLDELDWSQHGSQSFRCDLHEYEYVMYKQRQLSDRVGDIQYNRCPIETNFSPSTVEEELKALLKYIEELSNDKFKAYYNLKLYKLLGQLASSENNLLDAVEYFKAACETSNETFGNSFWSIHSYQHLAICQGEIGEKDTAVESFDKAYTMAQSAGWFYLPVICSLFLAYAKFCLKHEDMKERAKDLLNVIIDISYQHSKFDFFSKALDELWTNFPQYPQNMIKDIDKDISDKILIGLVDSMSKAKLEVTNQSTEREVVQGRAMNGIKILKSGIAAAKKRIDSDRGDKALLEDALFNWNRNIALYCSHVLLEKDRKPHAIEALVLAKGSNPATQNDTEYLKLVKDSNSSDEDQKMILEVSFLVKTNKHMAECKEYHKQKMEILNALEKCKQSWLRLKLLACQLELTICEKSVSIALVNDIANLLFIEKSLQFKPAFVIYSAIQDIRKRKLKNEEILQLNDICLKCCIHLTKGSSKRDKGMECKFQMCQIELLQQCNDSHPKAIIVLMQKVLEYGKQNKASRVLTYEKEYQKYIDDHSNILYQARMLANHILLWLA